MLHADHVRQHSRHTQSPGSLHPNDTGRSSRQTSRSSIRPGLTVPQEGGDRPILTRVRHGTCDVCTESLYVLIQNARRPCDSRRVSADFKWKSYGVPWTLGLRLACDDRTMPIFAFSCGLRRVTLRCPYDSTTSYDLRSLYDFVIVCIITNF